MQSIEEITKEILDLENSIKGKKDTGVYGTMVKRYTRCGKEGCKCEFGQKHGPYPVIQLYDKDGEQRNVYLGVKNDEEYTEKIKENDEYFTIIKKLNKLYLRKRKLIKKKQKNILQEETKEKENKTTPITDSNSSGSNIQLPIMEGK